MTKDKLSPANAARAGKILRNGHNLTDTVKDFTQADRKLAEEIFLDSFVTMSRLIQADNAAKGFWDTERNFGEVIALMHSELSEALEAHRKDMMDDHLPHRKGIEVELADCMIRIMDTAAGFNLNVGSALLEKLAYNRNRPHKHGKAY